MKAPRTWILIADGARARIALSVGRGRGLQPALDHEFGAPHAKSERFLSDRPGRASGASVGGRHGVGPRTDPRDTEKRRFVRDIARVVDTAAARRTFDRLILVAPPATLGALRAALGPDARRLVTAEIGKDLTHLPLREVPAHLVDALVA